MLFLDGRKFDTPTSNRQKKECEKVKAMFLRLEKGSFPDSKTGEIIDYCKMTFATKVEDNKDILGYELFATTTKATNYSKIKDFVSIKNPVEIEEEYVRAKDGLFKRKVSKINDIEL